MREYLKDILTEIGEGDGVETEDEDLLERIMEEINRMKI